MLVEELLKLAFDVHHGPRLVLRVKMLATGAVGVG